MDSMTARLGVLSLSVLAVLASCSGRTTGSLPGHRDVPAAMAEKVKSVSPALMPAPPMAQTARQPHPQSSWPCSGLPDGGPACNTGGFVTSKPGSRRRFDIAIFIAKASGTT